MQIFTKSAKNEEQEPSAKKLSIQRLSRPASQ
jgi:hypothetical protein